MIKVNGYTQGITISGDIVSPEHGIELVENNTTSGSSSFTITEDGTYLIIVSVSHQGSRSITLPQGRTATISQDVEINDGHRGMSVVVVDLMANDVVTLSATPTNWNAFGKLIYKLSNTSVNAVYNTKSKADGTETFSVPTSGDYLVICVCFGLTSGYYYDLTDEVFASKNITNRTGVNTLSRVFADKGENIPTIELYGNDGGGDFFVAISLN